MWESSDYLRHRSNLTFKDGILNQKDYDDFFESRTLLIYKIFHDYPYACTHTHTQNKK